MINTLTPILSDFKTVMDSGGTISLFNESKHATLIYDTNNGIMTIYKSFPIHKTVFYGVVKTSNDLDVIIKAVGCNPVEIIDESSIDDSFNTMENVGIMNLKENGFICDKEHTNALRNHVTFQSEENTDLVYTKINK